MGKELQRVLADHALGRHSAQLLHEAIPHDVAEGVVVDDDALAGAGDDLGGELVGVAQPPLDLFAFLDRAGEAVDVDADLELFLGLPGERPKGLDLPLVELSRAPCP